MEVINAVNGRTTGRAGRLSLKPELDLEANLTKDTFPLFVSNFTNRAIMHRTSIKEIIRQGNLSTLEEVVLQGYGDRLLGQTSSAPLVQEFLDKLPNFLDQITELHRTAMKGNLREFQGLLDRKSMIMARDQIGAAPLHKAVLYGHYELAEYIATNFPATLDARDNDGRTALHYASALDDDRNFYNMLVKAGAHTLLPDLKGKTADFYLRFPDQINLQQIMKRSQRLNANYAINTANRIKSKSSSRRKERSLSPSYRLKRPSDVNGLGSDGHSEEASSDSRAETSSTDGSSQSTLNYYRKGVLPSPTVPRIDVSSANLKRWIQENNVEMLEGVVLEGHGQRLREKAEYFADEDSTDSREFIAEAMPKMMNKIRVIHAAVSCGDLTGLQDQLDKQDFILSKDHLGMAPLHKATIMGHIEVVDYILDKFPETVNCRDKEGRTALHYSAATTNRNGSRIYKMLVRAGADPRIRDSSGKTAEYYRVHLLSLPNELSRINSKKKLNPITALSDNQPVKKRPLLLPHIQERITTALHDGDAKQLQELVLDGYGDPLIGRTSWGEEARKFLKGVPHLMDQIKTLHASIINGDIANVERILADDSALIRAKDENGLLPIHIATAHNRPEVVDYLVTNYPQHIHLKDSSGRTALHISAQNKTIDIYRKLVESGGDPKVMDSKGKTADHYLRAQTIQNYDFVSPLNGELVNAPDGKRQSKAKIKPVGKTSKTNKPSGDATAEPNTKTSSAASDASSLVSVPAQPSNRLPALKSDEANEAESRQNQSQTNTDDYSGDNERADSSVDQSKAEPSAPSEASVTQTASEANSEPDQSHKDDPLEEGTDERADSSSELSVVQTQALVVPIDQPISNETSDSENVSEDTTQKVDNSAEQEKTGVEGSEDRTGGQEMVETNSEPNIGNESEIVTTNEDKGEDMDSDNRVKSDEANGEPNQELVATESEPNGQPDSSALETNETAIIDKSSGDEYREERDSERRDGEEESAVNDEQKRQLSEQSEQTIETSGTVGETGTNSKLGTSQQTEGQQNQSESDIEANEQSIGTDGGEAVVLADSQVISESDEQINAKQTNDSNETNDSDNQQIGDQDMTQTTGGQPEAQPAQSATDTTQERQSSAASRSMSEMTDSESQQTVIENKPSDSQQLSPDEEKELPKDSEQMNELTVEPRPSTEELIRRQSGAENGVGKSLLRQNSVTSAKLVKDDSIRSETAPEVTPQESSVPQEVGEQVANQVITETMDTIKGQTESQSDETVSQNEETEPLERTTEPKIDTQESEPKAESDELNGEQKESTEENVPSDNGNGVQGVSDADADRTEAVVPNEDKSDLERLEGQQSMTGNEVVDDQSDARDVAIDDTDGTAADGQGIDDHASQVPNDDESVGQTIDTNNNSNDNNANLIADNEKETEVSAGTDVSKTNDGADSQTINDNSIVANDHNNNVDKREVRRGPSGLSYNGRSSSQFERALSRQSTVSNIQPHTDDRLNELIDRWIEESDLLRLEHVVIAGQGERLLHRSSTNKQVQDFLELVPTYMSKIRAVHDTVVRGNLNEVKQVLTRKRFALSRDHVGASPLHLAVLHGHLDVMLYIISQFPETINGPDNEGRTPLHYSAVMTDEQKQFYKLLAKAGADPQLKDKLGRTAEYYLDNPTVLTIRQLLENYMPAVDDELDKNTQVWQRPPTAEIESRLTPTPDDSDSPNPSPNLHEVDAEVHVDADRSGRPKTRTFSRSNSRQSQSTAPELAEDEDFETKSNEFRQQLKEEKSRLQKNFDSQMSTPDALAVNGSVIDNVQEAQRPVGDHSLIMNGENSSGYDLTDIKDENGQTVMHQLAAKPHLRSVFYKMLSQAEYLIPERDAKYRTMRDITVENGIKDNLQVIDQYILDAFTAQHKSLITTLALEGYNNLLTVVDAEGHDVIATLKRNNQTSMMEMVKDLAQFQKNRDELHTFIRHGYPEGVCTLVYDDPSLVVAKSERGRHSLHIAVLFANLEIINTLLEANPKSVNTPDNMGRTPLHYAMASSLVEDIGRILIRRGANRSMRDVKMRTPSYYFVYKDDIRNIKREEQNLTI